MVSLCRYLLQGGSVCSQPAVRDEYYCRHHFLVKRVVKASVYPPEDQGLRRPIPFAYPEDRASVQANYYLLMRALHDRRIDATTANAINRILRSCAMNLKEGPLDRPDGLGEDAETEDSMATEVILTPEGEEMGPAREVRAYGEKEAHGASCPCRSCGEQYRGVEAERHHAKCRCGKCSVRAQGPGLGAQEETGTADGVVPRSQKRDDLGHPHPAVGDQEGESDQVGGVGIADGEIPRSQKRDLGHPDCAGEPALVPSAAKEPAPDPDHAPMGERPGCVKIFEEIDKRYMEYPDYVEYVQAAIEAEGALTRRDAWPEPGASALAWAR